MMRISGSDLKLERVTAFYTNENCSDWPDENPIKFIQWFHEKIDLIPLEFRKTARIEISSGYYDVAEIYIYYYRLENEEEIKKRLDELKQLEF